MATVEEAKDQTSDEGVLNPDNMTTVKEVQVHVPEEDFQRPENMATKDEGQVSNAAPPICLKQAAILLKATQNYQELDLD